MGDKPDEKPGGDGNPEEGKPDGITAEEAAQLRADLASSREQLAELRGRLEQISAQTPVQETRREARDLTRSELREMVDRGDITEDQMLDRLDQQAERRYDRKLKTALDERDQASAGQRLVDQELDAYRKVRPGIDQPGHADRAKVESEYNKLLGAGFAKGDQTLLTALARAFGPAAPAPAEHRRLEDTHRETTSSSTTDAQATDAPDWAKGLDARQRGFYEKQLKVGIYKGPDDPDFKRDIQRAARAH